MVFAEDMNEEMQEMAIGAATAAFQKTFVNGNVYAQIAAHIRQDYRLLVSTLDFSIQCLFETTTTD